MVPGPGNLSRRAARQRRELGGWWPRWPAGHRQRRGALVSALAKRNSARQLWRLW